jgi:hypothetical protein
MDNTLKKGLLTELECQKAFIDAGCSVSIPLGNFDKYDMIVDVDGKLLKIQVKSSVYDEIGKSLHMACRTTTTNTKKTVYRTYSKDDIDYFATYWDGKCYLIPVEECSTVKYIRFEPPKNCQWSQITWGPDYEIHKVLNHIKNNEPISRTNGQHQKYNKVLTK